MMRFTDHPLHPLQRQEIIKESRHFVKTYPLQNPLQHPLQIPYSRPSEVSFAFNTATQLPWSVRT
jgi:hypothetical protein